MPPSFAPVSFPAPEYLFYSPTLLQLDLNIYREPVIKSLIKKHSEDLYRLIKKTHFDGKYYQVKSVRSGGWEYCWELAVRVEFFGKLQGLAFEPERVISERTAWVPHPQNPHELWDEELVERLWNIQERIEFLTAKSSFTNASMSLFHWKKPAIRSWADGYFSRVREVLEFANSGKLCPESRGQASSESVALSPASPESSASRALFRNL